MKKIYSILLLFSFWISFSQIGETDINGIAAAERRSASRLMNLAVNPNTQNYDVTYHKLEFTVDPAIYSITGKVTTTFTALSNMTQVYFDFSKITDTADPNYANRIIVSSVKQNGNPVVFLHSNTNELIITLATTLTAGNSTSVEITYSGAPANSGFGSFELTTHNGAPIVWTLSEPFGARDWWPCKQDLNDKVNNIDVYITAPSQYVAVSNGVETTAPIISVSNKTTHFHHGYPIPAYLICMAVSNYDVINQTSNAPNSFPIINYVFPEDNNSALQTQLAQTPLLLDLYRNLFEIYPFYNEKYGHAQFGWGGGMEHTTVSFMVNFGRQLVAHEMAHQWFGDKITCGSWKDIWLNEGFATYLASLVYEHFDGVPAFVNDKANMINYITSQPGGAVYLTDAEATNVNRIFSSRLTYNKGAMVLEMLRWKMGDTAFFQAVKNYLADTNLAYGYAITTDFKSHLEAVYGSSLTEFFNDWVYGQGYPTYTITVHNTAAGQAQITVNQTQSVPTSVSFFEMPLPIHLTGSGGQTYDVTVNNTTNGQQFLVNVPFAVTGADFDTQKHIISANNTISLANTTFELDKVVELYPNPASKEIHIKIPDDVTLQNVIIYNTLGQKVLEKNNVDFSVSEIASGSYFVEILTSEGTIHKKMIKN